MGKQGRKREKLLDEAKALVEREIESAAKPATRHS
jgi:hypothetical protein